MNKAFLFSALALLLVSGCTSSTAQNLREKKGDIFLTAGTEALNLGNYPEAIGSLQESVKFMPQSGAAWTNLGLAYAGKEENGRAEDCLKRAVKVDPKWTDAKANLGALYIKLKRYKEAEKVLKEALTDLTYTRTSQIHYNLAVIYGEWKRTLLAEQQLKLALSSDDRFCAAWFRLGLLQKARDEFEKAANSLTKSVDGECYNNPRAHYEIGSIYLKFKEIARAKSKLLDIIQLFPESDWAKKAEITLNTIR